MNYDFRQADYGSFQTKIKIKGPSKLDLGQQ